MEHILIDIETIASKAVIDNTDLIAMAKQNILAKEYNPNWKLETVNTARAKDLEAVEASTIKAMSLKPAQAQVCCVVAHHWDNNHDHVLQACGPEEREILAELSVFLHPFYESQVKFVGFNIRDFDIPVLAAAYMRNQMKIPPTIRLALVRQYDQVDLFKLFPNCGKMRVFCEALGIENEYASTGADVAQQAADGKWNEILNHCIDDVRQLDAMYDLVML